MKVAYWSPYIGHVGTIKAVVNSAASLKKYGNHDVLIIKNHSEWEGLETEITGNKINIEDFGLKKYFPNLHKTRFMGSRLYMLVVALFGYFQLRSFLKHNKQDVLITNLVALPAILAAISVKKRPKIIASIQGYPKFLGLPDESEYKLWMKIEDWIRKRLWNFIYTKVDSVVCMTEPTKKKLCAQTKIPKNKIVVVENAIIDESILEESNLPLDDSWFKESNYKKVVAIGRLTFQKDFETLISAIYKISTKKVVLAILGEGEKREDLQSLINHYGLAERVRLLGFIKNPYNYLREADLFVLSSRWEDPGHVILEAGMLRVPIVTTNCPTGPEEILCFGKGGWVCNVEDSIDMAKKITQALESDNSKKLEVAYNSVMRFSLYEHFKKINAVIENEN